MTTIDAATEHSLLQPAWPCAHQPHCPSAENPNRDSARLRVAHPEQGWSLLCNGVVVFDDTGELLPDGRVIAPLRATAGMRTDPAGNRTHQCPPARPR